MLIGIAGYTGSGKSTCADILCGKDCEIINGDIEGKKLMQLNSHIKRKLVDVFGPEAVCDNDVCFEFLSENVFSSYSNLDRLNKIVHPKLISFLRQRIKSSEMENVILDAALIPFWKIENWFDNRVWIDVPFEIRLKRLEEKYPEKSKTVLRKRMNIQSQLFKPPENSDWIKVDNSGDLKKLKSNLLKNDSLKRVVAKR